MENGNHSYIAIHFRPKASSILLLLRYAPSTLLRRMHTSYCTALHVARLISPPGPEDVKNGVHSANGGWAFSRE